MSTAKVLFEGLYFGEGPRWRDGRLWLSDFYAHAVFSMDPAGNIRTELELDDQPSGLGWLPDGRLLIVAMQAMKVLRLDEGGLTEHADVSSLSRHLCNDMVVDGQGRAWVGNFGFDLDEMVRRVGPEQMFENHPSTNLVRVDPDGSVHLAADDMDFPNGSVVTPDGRTLIVAETLALRLTAFDIAADGSLSNRRVWASTGTRAPDGICLDVDGNIDVGDTLDLSENLDVGDLEIDTDHYDLGGFDDFGGADGSFDVDPGDFGGDAGFLGDDDFGDFGGFDDFDF